MPDDAAGEQPAIERRRWPRRSKHHGGHVHWKHIAIYVPVVLLVTLLGGLALWSFVQRQSVVIVPEAIPRVTLVTGDPDAPLTAAWVKLFTAAAIETTVVRAEGATADGLVARCGRGIAVLGMPPSDAPASLAAERGMSDNAIKLGATPSPILARLTPGGLLPARAGKVALLEEKPGMHVDARWRDNARAAVMHMETPGARLLWIGFDPDAVAPSPPVLLMLRTSFRWIAEQPISSSRNEGLVVTVERLRDRHSFAVKLLNRTQQRIKEPAAEIWFPPGVTRVALDGDVIMRRGAVLTNQDDLYVLTLPSLARNEQRVLKLAAR